MKTKELADYFGVTRAAIYQALRTHGHFYGLTPVDHPGHGKIWSKSKAEAVKQQIEEAAK